VSLFARCVIALRCGLFAVVAVLSASGDVLAVDEMTPNPADGPTAAPVMSSTPEPAPTEAPPPTATTKPPPTYFDDPGKLISAMDDFAVNTLGFKDENGNGRPDFRERYAHGKNDCTTVSAQVAWILGEMGRAGLIDPEQVAASGQIRGGGHSANWVAGIGVIDLTPVTIGYVTMASNGTPWYAWPPGETFVFDNGYPDPGEVPDPAYRGPTGPPKPPEDPGETQFPEGTPTEGPTRGPG